MQLDEGWKSAVSHMQCPLLIPGRRRNPVYPHCTTFVRDLGKSLRRSAESGRCDHFLNCGLAAKYHAAFEV